MSKFHRSIRLTPNRILYCATITASLILFVSSNVNATGAGWPTTGFELWNAPGIALVSPEASERTPSAKVVGCLPFSIVYVDDDWSATTPGTDPDGGGPATNYGCDSFSTIQDGIVGLDAAGGTINLLAGIYSETGQIIIAKNISIIGADNLTTAIQPAQNTGTAGDAKGWFLVQTGIAFDLSNVTLDGTGQLTYQAIRYNGSGSINNVKFANIQYLAGGPTYNGGGVRIGAGNVDVTNCTFNNMGRYGVLAEDIGTGTLSGNTYTGKGPGDWLDYGFDIEFGSNYTIANNVISGNRGIASSDGSDSAGISVWDDPGTQAVIIDNAISDCSTGIAVAIFSGSADPLISIGAGNVISGGGFGVAIQDIGALGAPSVSINSSTITGNTVGVSVQPGMSTANMLLQFNRITGNITGISNAGVDLLNAENNWWGCNAGPGSAGCDSTTGTVDFDPWMVLGVSATPLTIAAFGSSSITADMTKNSDGATPLIAVPTGLPDMPVAFSATNGTMAPPAGTVTAGMALSTFTSTSTSSGTGCATVTGQLVCASVIIDTTAPVISYTPIPNTTSTANPTLSVTITDTGGVVSATLFFSIDGAAYNSTACNLASGTVQNGVWDCVVNGVLSNPSSILYYVVATDVGANSAVDPSAGTSAPNLFTIGAATVPGGTYTNLSLSNGAILGADLTVLEVLTLGGVIDTAGNTLIIDCAGSVAGAGSANYVVGNVLKNYCAAGPFSYPVGTANGYSPVEANVTAFGGAGDGLAVRAVQNYYGGNAETPALDPTSLQRYWDLNETGSITADITFRFLPGDVVGGGVDYTVIRINPPAAASFLNAPDCSANPLASPCVNIPANYMFMAAISNFSRWTAGPALGPTEAEASISGRILTADGRGIAHARVVLNGDSIPQARTVVTGPFGFYAFDSLSVGQTYVITVDGRRFSFANPSQIFSLNGSVTNADFTAEPAP